MTFIQALLLGVLQGATEFLPVSSSGHLVLVPWLLGWPSPGLGFDVVVHWGTACAVLIYFWRDWLSILRAVLRWLTGLLRRPLAGERQPLDEEDRANVRLAALIVLGSIPAGLAGVALEDLFESMFARPSAAAGFLLVTAGLLTASEFIARRVSEADARSMRALGWPDALLIGLAQALAIFPGISRSGATIAAGLGRGLQRRASARFSFLLATPIILGAGLFKLIDLFQAGQLASQAPTLALGFLVAGVVGLACIHFLLRFVQRRRLYVFAIYCLLMGVVCLVLALVRGGGA
jgi:undecaprenyl-diphosphatase